MNYKNMHYSLIKQYLYHRYNVYIEIEYKLSICILIFLFFVTPTIADEIDDLKIKAKTGNPTAQYDLAIHYLNSETTNYIEVLELLRNSSKQGNINAMNVLKDLSTPGYDAWGDYNLLPQYDLGCLSDNAKSSFLEWATNGCGAKGCKGHKGYYLCIAHSFFHEKNYSKAVYYYKKALSQMNNENLGKFGEKNFSFMDAWMDAYTMLGFCYEHGYGVTQNYKMAIDYYLIGGIYLDDNKYDISNIKKFYKKSATNNLQSFV